MYGRPVTSCKIRYLKEVPISQQYNRKEYEGWTIWWWKIIQVKALNALSFHGYQ